MLTVAFGTLMPIFAPSIVLDGIWITQLFSFVVAFICTVVIDKHIQKKTTI